MKNNQPRSRSFVLFSSFIKCIKCVALLFLITVFAVNTSTAQCGLGTASQIAAAPTMTGAADATWASAPVNTIGANPNNTVSNNSANQALSTGLGTNDGFAQLATNTSREPGFAATWQAQWTSTTLYILVQVTDATVHFDPILNDQFFYNYDAVEVYLSGNNNHGGFPYGADDVQYGFSNGVYRGIGGGSGAGSSTVGVTETHMLTGVGYNMAITIPLSSFSAPGTMNSQVSFDIAVDDDDHLANILTEMAADSTALVNTYGETPANAHIGVTGFESGGDYRDAQVAWHSTTGQAPYNNPSQLGNLGLTAPPTPSVTANQIICGGGTTTLSSNNPTVGTGAWTAANGISNVSQLSSTTSTTPTFTPPGPGTYLFTWTISNTPFCSAAASTSNDMITVTAVPTISGTLNTCIGGNTTLTGSGVPAAVNPWVSATPGVATVTNAGVVTGVSAGTSVITYTNNNGCSITATVTINALPTITLSAIAPTCFLAAVQTVNLPYTATTGAPTTYSINGWSGGGFANVVNAALPASPISITVPAGVAGGAYTANLTVSNGTCTSIVYPITVTINALPTITLSAIAPTCFSAAVQTVNLPYTATTGAPTTYSINGWSGGGFANVVNAALPASPISITVPAGVAGGAYTASLTVKNANGCVSSVSTITVTINALPTITLSAIAPTCFSAAVQTVNLPYTATTGAPTTYSINGWSGGGFANVVAAALPASPISITVPAGVAGGAYTANLTVSNGTCTSIVYPITVTINALPTITLSAIAPTCFSAAVQTVNLPYTATTGVPTTYSINGWSGGGFANVVNAALPATPIVVTVPAGAAAGAYTASLTVKNANGCVSSVSTITVTINALPTITLSAIAPTCFSAAVQTVNLPYTATTGAPTTYSINGWSGGGFANVVAAALPVTPIVITVPAGVVGGAYTANLTVNNGTCTSIVYPITVTINALPTITLSAIAPTCFSAAVQTVNLPYTATTGAPTTYSINGWSGGGFANVVNAPLPATPIVITVPAGVASGAYTANLTISNGTCTSIVYPITVTINALPTITLSAIAPTCFSAAVQTVNLPYTATTGAPTTYSINGWSGGGFANVVAAALPATPIVITVPAGVAGGAYTANLTVNNGTCTSIVYSITVTINALPTITLSAIAPTCFSAAVQTVNLPYTATTGAPTTYNINGWSGGGFANVVAAVLPASPISITVPAGVASGAYTANLTVNNGTCTSIVYGITVTVNALPTIGGTLNMCVGGNTTLTGSPTAAAVNPWISATTAVATITNAGVVTGVSAGTSIITYTNTNGCTITATATVNAIPTITGAASVAVGATTPWTGSPTPAAVNPWVSATPAVATVSNAGVVTGVSNGTSVITYTNTNGCTITKTITVNNLPTISGPTAMCLGSAPITLTGSGTPAAVTPWTSSTPAVATVSNTGVVTSISVGTTTITYTDNNGNSVTQVETVNPLPTIGGILNTCIGGNTTLTGSATPAAVNPWVSATPAVATITNAGVVTGVSAGTSVITYTNTNGCTITATVTINPLPTIGGTLNACIGGTTTLTGSATPAAVNPWVSATPAVATITNAGVVTGISAGTSVITYTNTNGCTITATVTINALPTIGGTLNACVGANTTLTGSPTPAAVNPWVSATPAVATITNAGVVTGVSAGTSIITYTNTNGCTATATITINALPTIAGAASVAVGSTTPWTGSPTPAAVNPWVSATPAVATVDNAGVVTGVSNGTSVITYTNSNGCTITKTITVNNVPTISGPMAMCLGSAPITLTGSGTPAVVTPWVSSAPAVATVSNTGIVTSISVGTTTITYTDNNGNTATQVETINPLPTIGGTLNACIGGTTTLTGSATPAAVNPWVSATPAVATITNAGVVTGVSAGTSLITYTNTNGCTITATITINALPTIGGTLNTCIGSTTTLTGSATPAAVNPWISATTGVATITNTGVVTGVSAGTSIITYTNTNGCTTTATVTINALPTIGGPLTMCVGGTTTLTGSPTPAVVNSWVSATPAVATITNTGVVAGIANGTSVITYTNTNGCTATATVTINALPTIAGAASVAVGATTPWTGSPTPAAVNPWVSATPGVATISNVGVVTGVSNGTSVITYTNTNGCTITKTITVNNLPTISGPMAMCLGSAPITLIGSGTPAAVNPWISGTPAVAIVSNTGVVTGVSAGTTTITYTDNNGNSASQVETINPLPTITGTLNVCIGNTTPLTGSATPAAVTPWVSGNTAVATIDNAGVVTGVTAGTSIITYTNSNGCTITATVTVNALPIITGTLTVCATNTTPLTGSGIPAAVNPWVSATPAVATVNNAGVVTGVSAGTSVITYTNNNGCTITVTVPVNALPAITGTLNACIGNTSALAGSGIPAAVNPWISATPGVATVTNAGVVSGVSAGTSVITYTNNNGCTTTATFTVNPFPTITGSATVIIGNTDPLTGSGIPAAVTPWVSSNPGVATVNNTGVVTGVSNGTTVITYTNNNGCTVTQTITVNTLPTLSGPTTLCLGSSITLTGSGTPAAVNPYISSTPAVATVSNTGVVTSVSAGTTTITYTDNSGNTATQVETINALPTITGTLNVCIDNTTALTGSPVPAAVNPWISATPGVATVTNVGVVTGVSGGTSIITYTNNNGCIITATVTVNTLPTITGTLNVCVGNTTPLSGSGIPAAVNPWVSASPAVATVDNAGVVSGVSAGTSVITYTNNNGCTITATVTVNALPTITGTLNVCVGNTTTLTGSVTPAAVNPWVSATPAVATVNNTGLVLGVSAGTSVITYTNSNGCTITATVTVNALPTITGTFNVCVGNTTTLTGSAAPAAVNPWVSGTPAVATVNNTGVVTGISAGTSIITYTNSNGCTTTATITVNGLPTISGTLNVCVGNTTNLTGSGTPAAVNPWISATPAVATIDNAGVVTGVSAGSSVITYTNNNGCTTTATVTVNALPTITGTLNVCVGNTTNLTGSPTAAITNPWISANTAVATVSNTGVVSGVAGGTSVITYTNSNGCTITATVTVNALPTITGTLAVCVGSTQALTGSGIPAAVNPWLSSNPAAATIDNAGVVSGVSAGSSVITYTNNNGCVTTATVTINATPVLKIQNPNAVCSPGTVDITNPSVAINNSTLPPNTSLNYYADMAATIPVGSPQAISTSGTYYIQAIVSPSGCNTIDPVSVTINPQPAPLTPTGLNYCQGEGNIPALTANADPGNTLVWYKTVSGGPAGTTALQYPSTATGTTLTYFVTQINGSGCESAPRGELDVKVTTLPIAVAIANPTEVYAAETPPATINLYGSTTGLASAATVAWYQGEGFTLQIGSTDTIKDILPPATIDPPLDTTRYYFVATSTENTQCADTVSVLVKVVQHIVIPNIFSPNGDGVNDFWDIKNIQEFSNAEVSIFNRYGQFIYTSGNGYRTPWDGKYHGQDLPVGTYFYIIKTTPDAKPIAGDVSIVR